MAASGQSQRNDARLSVLLFGDVNLGRYVGQQLVRGDLQYPFAFVSDTLRRYDIVFANLESQLSDQNGETQHPKYNLIFTGPPAGARALSMANVAVVSTANNHAFDYGFRGERETLLHLGAEGIAATGTSFDSVGGALPAIVERNGLRIAFLAYTEFVNIAGGWRGRIALYDSVQCRKDIEAIRGAVDFVVVSYHGGAEYSDKPTQRARRAFEASIEAGADLVVGHHPHYVQGVELYRGKPIFYSLGNFVFYQPQREQAGFGLGICLELAMRSGTVTVESVRLVPVRAGLQPTLTLSDEERRSFVERLRKLSPAELSEQHGNWFVHFPNSYE